MECKNSGIKCFTFLWKLENISYSLQKVGSRIESPAFVVDAIEKTKWKLRLYPRGDRDGTFIGFFLHREKDSKGEDEIEIEFELDFIGKDGSSLRLTQPTNYAFPKSIGFGFTRDDVCISKRLIFLPDDTLKAHCRIWKISGELSEDIQCTALTRIGVEKRSLKWIVKNFSTLEVGKKCNLQIKSIQDDVPLLSVDLSLTEGLNSDENITFELFLLDRTIKFSTLRVFLIDSSGSKVECNQEEIWFDDPAQCKQLTCSFTNKKLLEEKNKYLPEDTLSLFWEFAFSKGVVSEEIVEDEHGCICPEVKISDVRNINNDKTILLTVLADNLKTVYNENFLSDVKLKTNHSVFPAHKLILSAASSVFKAMFSRDMKERDGDCVTIEDVSDDTMSRMLLFIYTTRVEDLTWESASDLYVAADKYAILSLKNVCSSYMKDNLSPSNACKILLLSELHTDSDLKSIVQDYILKHGKQITRSDEWKALIQINAKLAAETLCLLFK
ncbi:speckle-type POZ protein-like [Argiope bruennichi]|uniref:speckle-type POZ protein-like n=1 Tax=Argiope bruennichi TaxID=94029 RepID=UPI002494B80A|nr:speckle-type POZ protein-like [Argiope bruennichi]